MISIFKAETPTKAVLLCRDNSKYDLELTFNPSSLTISRTPEWGRAGEKGESLSDKRLKEKFRDMVWQNPDVKESQGAWAGLSYSGATNDTLNFKTIFDETIDRSFLGLAATMSPFKSNFGSGNTDSVLVKLLKLHTLTLPSKIAPTSTEGDFWRPPVLTFLWGGFRFEGVIKSLNTDITLFSKDGTPKRAEVSINMEGMALTKSSDVNVILNPNETYRKGTLPWKP
jgi:hypothetical protein